MIWNTKRNRIESVAEHTYKTQMLALAMKSEFNYDIDIEKVICMLSVHELEEIIIGDVAMSDSSYKLAKLKGAEAVKQVLSCLEDREYISSIVSEFETKKTKEAIFAYHCDKLECDLQAKLYDEEGCFDINNILNKKNIIKNDAKTFTDIWFDADEHLYNDDENFKKIFNYAKKNKISLVR